MIDINDRFWKQVNFPSENIDIDSFENECWNWKGCIRNKNINRCNYGVFRYNNKNIASHRMAYTLTYGEIPEQLCVLHTCDNRLCVNPKHLKLGTKADNNKDCAAKNRTLKGTQNNNATLTDDKVIEIRELYKEGFFNMYELGSAYHVYPSTIERIINRKTWKHI